MKTTLVLPWLLMGCAAGAAVRGSEEMPVQNVVLYRNGVGYFERSGRFEGEALAFSVRRPAVGDFLASLTAVERTQGGVSSIAFEVPEGGEDGERVDVKLMLSHDGEHDVSVAYVVGAPIWRPSYRLVFDDEARDKLLLQAWAVVQNTSGEDWRDVSLTLTTGSPISFRSDLGTPITPERPFVSDEGEVVQGVPVADVVLAQEEATYDLTDEGADQDRPEGELEIAAEQSARMKSRRMAPPAAPTPAKPAMSAAGMASSVRPSARVATLEESVTHYQIADRVTVPDGSSTMVAILSREVPGERAHLFAPNPDVPLSSQHPFAVARLKNETGAVLEKGPVSVLGEGAFLGQGVLDTLPRGADSFIPFALDKSLVVENSQRFSEQDGTLVRIARGMVTIERFSQRSTTYAVRNGGAVARKVYLRHPRWLEAELHAPPKGTELSPEAALVPLEAPAHGHSKLEVIERTPVRVELRFLDQAAADAIALWLSGPAAEAAQGEALRQALALREELVSLREALDKLSREQHELAMAAEETRANLKAIQKIKNANDLRTQLVTRLDGLGKRLSELTSELVAGRTRESELEVRLKQALEGVTLIVK